MRILSLSLAVLLALSAGASRAAAQAPADAVSTQADTLFDGAKNHRGFSSGPKAADPDGLDAKQRALLDGLLAHVEVKPGDDPRAPALLHSTFVKLVRTPTGAEMAARFIGENARAVVQFGAMENSAVTIVNGKAVLLYSGGQTEANLYPPVVTLNKGYMDSDAAWRGPEMAGTLGHELFGHALQSQRADKAGVTDAFDHYRGDEANAGMLGWLVGMEAGGPADNAHMWTYLRDPEAYHKNLEMTMAYYATTFSVAELKDPLATLKTRRDQVGTARTKLLGDVAATDAWRPIMEHFIKVHGMRSEDFKTIRETIDSVDAFEAPEEKEFDHMEAYIDSLSNSWRTDGKAELARIESESSSPYFVGTEERLQVLRRRLQQETANRKPEPSIPPVPGQITFDQLSEMYQKDMKEHPEHWSK